MERGSPTPTVLTQYDRLLRRDPDNVDYLFGKAQVLVLSGQPEAARPLRRRARALASAHQDIWRLQPEVLSELGLETRPQESPRADFLEFGHSPWDSPQQIIPLPVLTDPGYSPDSSRDGNPVPGGENGAQDASFRLHAPNALAQYDRLLRRHPDNVDYLFGKALILVWSGQPGAARILLQRVRTLNPGYEEAWRLQLRVLGELGLDRQVQELVLQARRKFPRSRWDISQRGIKASPLADIGYALFPEDRHVPTREAGSATLAVPAKLDSVTSTEHRSVSPVSSDSVESLFSKAQALVLAGQPGAARPLLRRARTLNPASEDIWRLQLRVLAELGLERQAQGLVRQARQKFPQTRWDIPRKQAKVEVAPLGVLGSAPKQVVVPAIVELSAKSDAPVGVAQYDSLLQRYPDNVDYLFGKAQLLVLSGQPGAARPLLRRARTLNPASEAVWRLQLRVLSELGLERQAQELVRQARQKFPRTPWDIPPRNSAGFSPEYLDKGSSSWRGFSVAPVRQASIGGLACDSPLDIVRREKKDSGLSGFQLAQPWGSRPSAANPANPELTVSCADFFPVLQVAATLLSSAKAALSTRGVESQPDAASKAALSNEEKKPVLPGQESEAPLVFASGPAPYDPTLPESPAPSTSASLTSLTPAAAAGDAAAPASESWGLAPIRWGASVGLQGNHTSRGEGAKSSELMEVVNLRGATYIYQPWVAQVNGNLGLSIAQGGTVSPAQGEVLASSTRQNSSSVTGGAGLNLFSSSRFPFLATFDVSDSRSSSELVSTAYTNTRIGLRQSYSPESADYSAVGGFNRSKVDFVGQGSDTVNALYGDFSRNMENQSIQANLNYSQSTREQTGDNTKLMNLNARHTYRPLDNLSIDSLASLSDNTLNNVSGALGATRTHGRYLQLNSFANWHPEEDEDGNEIPLNVTGGVRALSALSETGGVATEAQSLGANATATYRYNQNLALTGSGVVTRIANAGGDSQMLALVGGGANYVGDPLTFGKFSYFWNAGANGNQQTGGKEGSAQTLSGQFGHSLFRPVDLDENSSLNFSLGQNVTQTSSGLLGNMTLLSHNAGAAYRAAFGESLNGTASLNLNDTITTGANAGGHFTNLTLLLTGQAQISRYSAGSINMTFQRMVIDNKTTQFVPTAAGVDPFSLGTINNRNESTNIFGSATYQHQRVFGVPRLRYYMNFIANTMASSRDERLAGNAFASVDNQTYTFDNRLDYRIGRLDLQLRGTVTELAGKKNAMIFFKVTREFGRF